MHQIVMHIGLLYISTSLRVFFTISVPGPFTIVVLVYIVKIWLHISGLYCLYNCYILSVYYCLYVFVLLNSFCIPLSLFVYMFDYLHQHIRHTCTSVCVLVC